MTTERICSIEGCDRPHYGRGWCEKHYKRARRAVRPIDAPPLGSVEAFWENVNKTGDCWLWTASTDTNGYGQFRPIGRKKTQRAHRVAYELCVGPIPDSLTLDHLCRVRRCVNPDHLEPVPIGVNVRRGHGVAGTNVRRTHCVNGHPFDEANTYYRLTGGRACRACRVAAVKRYQIRKTQVQ